MKSQNSDPRKTGGNRAHSGLRLLAAAAVLSAAGCTPSHADATPPKSRADITYITPEAAQKNYNKIYNQQIAARVLNSVNDRVTHLPEALQAFADRHPEMGARISVQALGVGGNETYDVSGDPFDSFDSRFAYKTITLDSALANQPDPTPRYGISISWNEDSKGDRQVIAARMYEFGIVDAGIDGPQPVSRRAVDFVSAPDNDGNLVVSIDYQNYGDIEHTSASSNTDGYKTDLNPDAFDQALADFQETILNA